jgi:hypothetical protein
MSDDAEVRHLQRLYCKHRMKQFVSEHVFINGVTCVYAKSFDHWKLAKRP